MTEPKINSFTERFYRTREEQVINGRNYRNDKTDPCWINEPAVRDDHVPTPTQINPGESAVEVVERLKGGTSRLRWFAKSSLSGKSFMGWWLLGGYLSFRVRWQRIRRHQRPHCEAPQNTELEPILKLVLHQQSVMPAKAGIQKTRKTLDSRLHGNDR